MPEKTEFTGVVGLALHQCSTGRTDIALFLASAFPQYVAVYRNGDHGAIIHGKGDYLAYSEEEHPVRCNSAVAIRRRWRSVRSWQSARI